MTKQQDRSKQLQLRLLVDVSGSASSLPITPKGQQDTTATSKGGNALPASENDMSVYRQISENYFRSLRKI